MATPRVCASTGENRRRRINCVPRKQTSYLTDVFWIVVSALLVAFVLAPAYADPEGCETDGTTADCIDVPVDGVRYISNSTGVTEVNVGDGVVGETAVTAGTIGIDLFRYGSAGGDTDLETSYETILWDTDGDASTADVSVVSADGATPLLVGGQFIFDNGGDPNTFTIGADNYTGEGLAEFLATTSIDAGASVTGSLTVNNQASFSTTNASGITANSTGGRGGNGGCWTILFLYSWCDDGDNGGSAGSVAVNNDGAITVNGDAEGQHGISAISQGGAGGNGGGFFGLVSSAGAGGDGGDGGDVSVTLGENSNITTHGVGSHGVFARSRGGDGGSGGDPIAGVALGDKGGNGGDAGNVIVNNDGLILTTGENSHGIYALSVGAGAGSGSDSSGIFAIGGNGGGQSDGAMVTVNNSGLIETRNIDSYGILAQSIGGGGGDGGGAGGWFAVGGSGGSGGNSNVVSVFDSGTVRTSGDRSTAIFAQSIGGGGGNGGDAVAVSSAVSVAVGGNGGLGGDGHEVHVITDGSDIDTSGDYAHGIHAQSIGGGGGNGGLAVSGALPAGSLLNVSVALGGNGAGGGDAGDIVSVRTSDTTDIDTTGDSAFGIAAQSIGGGGGNGGSSFSGAGGGGISVALGIGGTGGVGGDGKYVEIINAATISTGGDLSTGIVAQSIGGGGGNGGFAGALAGGVGSASIGIGGDGSAGGLGGEVVVENYGAVETQGENAIGIFAQSIGGSGGNGGSAMAGSAGLMAVSTTVGGGGGDGNDGGLVSVLNAGLISTLGNNSTGVFAQSVGGGGGNGGNATSVALAGPLAVTVGVGGSGGDGGVGGNVAVINELSGSIFTEGINSDGIFAQSVGGSGGVGGSATTVSLVFPVEIKDIEIPAISVNVAVGGRGGGGGQAGTVNVDNFGTIMTSGFLSNGVFAQSVGGSGGRGGNANNIQIAVDALFTGGVTIGGSGGFGGTGNLVTVNNSGLIHTLGGFSNGVFAQSIGGGGGLGGDATKINLSLTPPPTSPADFIPSTSMKFDLAIGGDGGDGGIGGDVIVTNTGTIITEGHFASGVMAQSVGGAGGTGGDARVISVDLSADPMDFISLLDLTSLETTLVFGGSGGTGGHGGNVTVTNDSDIATTGALAHGIVAQSVGGGGGSGGSAMTFEFSNTQLPIDIPVLDDISGLTTIEMTLQGSGGAGGNGGDILLNSNGNIWTEGDFAMGVVAQSVGGSGGLVGFYNPHGITNNEIFNAVFNTLVDTDAGLSFAGSVGGIGTAGDVVLNHTGNIQTLGDGAHGLFAQSAAGQGIAGNVDIMLDGDIYTFGEHAYGIFAQSGGGDGNGDISLTINDGIVMGGSGAGAGIFIGAGNNNSIWNEGLITSVQGINGHAIIATGGNDFIENFGTVTGSVNLGPGENFFANYGLVNSGMFFDMGANNLLLNEGNFAPGGVMNIFTTNVIGDFQQTDVGSLWFDLAFDFGLDSWDYLDISGISDLNGTLGLVLLDTGNIMPGEWEAVLISSAGGISNFGLTLEAATSAVINSSLMASSETDYSLFYNVDFAPTDLTQNQAAMGEHFNQIQLAGSTEMMKPLTASIVAQSDVAGLGGAYDMLSPHIYSANQLGTLFSSLDFEQSMHSCKVRDGDLRFSREGDCTWMRISDRDIDYEAGSGGVAATDYATIVNMGAQHTLSEHWHGGMAIGFEKSDFDIPLFAERSGMQLQAGGILKGRYGPNAVNLSMTMGRGDYDTRRYPLFAEDSEFIMSERYVRFFSAHAGYGYNFEGDNWFIQPGLDLGWTDVSGDAFDERGGGPTAMYVQETDDAYLTSRFDLRVGGEFSGNNQMLYRPYINTSYTHVLSGTTNEIRAKLVGAPESVPYFTQILEVDDNYTSIALGIDILARENWALSFEYDWQFAGSWDSRAYFAKAMFQL